MQQIFIEFWSIKDEWRALAPDARAAYAKRLMPAMQEAADEGLEILAWGYNEPGIDRRLSYDVFAVYRLPDERMLAKLQQMIAHSGWYTYFDQVNAGGAVRSPEAILDDHVALQR